MPSSPAASTQSATARQDALLRLLHRGPASAADLGAALSVSQPTLSRTIQALAQQVLRLRIPGQRTPRYALTRQLPGRVAALQNLYRIDEQGQARLLGLLAFLAGGQTLLRTPAGDQLFAGLPPSLAFAAPSGFLGRQLAHAAPVDLMLPPGLRDWSDDHRVAALVALGLNLPGDRVIGDAALEREMALRQAAPIADEDKLLAYETVSQSLADTAYGSSAGGEQPKFHSLTRDRGHVLVKFAARGSRMAELLTLEHLALNALQQAGLPAAATHLVEGRGQLHLEMERFDRVGLFGRRGMLSAGAFDDEHFGRRDSWSEFAERCAARRLLPAEAVQRIHRLAAFSELIGNTDRHFENLSFFVDEHDRLQGLTPAYDILPMAYAPLGGGIDPELRPIRPRLGAIGGRREAWAWAAPVAVTFWREVAQGRAKPRLSAAMREVAQANLQVVRDFVQPFAMDIP